MSKAVLKELHKNFAIVDRKAIAEYAQAIMAADREIKRLRQRLHAQIKRGLELEMQLTRIKKEMACAR